MAALFLWIFLSVVVRGGEKGYKMEIGYIGMGIMGRPMAGNLLKAGHELYIYNRTAEKCKPLADKGAVVCSSPAEVAEKVEVVFINVTDTPDVEEVIFGENGIAEKARSGLVVIDNSTISPVATRRFANVLAKKGTYFLDAPVSGGDIGAQKGTLAIMVGGDRGVYEKSLPLFEILGSKVVYLGKSGSGQTCKLCNQLFCALHMLACCEGIALAYRAGLDVSAMIEVVSAGAGGSWALKNLGPKIAAGDMEPGFMIKLLNKDLRLVMELAHDAKLPLTGATLAQQLFHEAEAEGLGAKGTQALERIIEKLGGFTMTDNNTRH